MRRFRLVALLLFLTLTPAAHAEAPPDPLRLVPEQADLFFKVERPRQLLEAVHYAELLEQLQTLDAVREQLDSTNVRRLLQMIAHFEKQLGLERMELLDQLAGGGAVLAIKAGPNPAPALFVFQGREDKLQRRFFDLAVEVLAAELARQEAKEKLETETYHGMPVVRIGNDFHAAVAGSALLVSNKRDALRAALDLHRSGSEKSLARRNEVREARELLPPEPLAWAWLNLATTLHMPFGAPDTPHPFGVLGGGFDVMRRAPFACAGFYRRGDELVATVRMPRGRDGATAMLKPHVAPAGQPGSRPLLAPPHALASVSFYLNLSALWEERAKILPDDALKGVNQLDANFGKLLAGGQLAKLLRQAGPYYRLVVAQQDKPGYKTVPAQQLPAFALVAEMREPDAFSRSAEAMLRTAALLVSAQVRLKLVEESYRDQLLIGYRFPEDAPLPGDVNNLRFNFSPCFVRVGNQFALCSTLELGREMVDLLAKDAKEPARPGSASPFVVRLHGEGAVALLKANEDQVFAQTVLAQAASPESARQQVQALLDLAKKLGDVRLETNYGAKDFRFDVVYTPAGAK
jgi:Protein of unknown function (DUF3352)